MLMIFRFINSEPLAAQKFLVFNQKELISNYIVIFQKYVTKIKWDNKIKQFIF